ncbi:MAG: hypothetical protein J6U44_04635, partial [Paludibacteraceae bacterium]|nr:hypothetical protein [Paludibacteraceae bacterium]
ANVQGIESASANVSDLGSAVVKIDPQPADVASPSWRWSETATPVTPDTDAPVCGGGGGENIAPLLTTYCSSMEKNTNAGTDRGISDISLNGSSVTINEYSSNAKDAYRGTKNNEASAIAVTKGSSYTLTVNGSLNWQYISCFADWNADGDFSDTNESIGLYPNDVHVFNDTNAGSRTITINVPADAASAYIPLRLKMSYCTNNAETAVGTSDPCSLALNKEQINQAVAADVVLKVKGVDANTRPATLSCTIPGNVTRTNRYLTSLAFTGNQGASLSSGTIQQGSTSEKLYHDLRNTHSLVVDPGETISTTPNWTGEWMMGYLYVDWNNDGDFTDSGEYVASPYNIRGGTYYASDWAKPNNFTVPTTATPGATYTMRYTLDWNSRDGNNAVDEGVDYPCGRTATTASGNFTADNGGVMVDFELKIEGTLPPATSGDGCAYVHDFGSVAAGSDVTYEMNLGAVVVIVKDSTLAAPFTATASGEKLIITYSPEAVGSHEAGFRISLDGGEEFPVSLTGTGVRYPNVTFRMGESGGGALSLDMGKTTFIESRTFAPYKKELLTAVPVGPTHIVGWYYSTDGGTSWTDVGHANPDYTYTGADDAIVEVRFDFDDFEGNFGNSRFTDNSNVPFYISAISTTNGIVNVNATDVFTNDSVKGGKARLRYMENQRLQTLHKSLNKRLEHDITVTLKKANKIPADARLLCFIDYNMNNYFDFASSPDG